MRAIIKKASNWNFEKVEESFVLSEETFERLTKEFDHHAFVVDFKPFNEQYDVEITVYDDYLE